MAYIDAIWQPVYAIKSFAKLILFLFIPLLFALKHKQLNLTSFLVLNKRVLKISFLFGICLFTLILGAYFAIGFLFDLSKITATLGESMGITAETFGFVAIYIALVNSFLEELFFRGFGYLKLCENGFSKRQAGLFSALAFAFYHVAMMIGWFDLSLFLLVLAALFVAGILFNAIDEKFCSIYPSYFIHMCANLAINTIGFILFAN